jgi:predicted nucleic acid-binding protein
VIYLDASALLKLVVREAETDALREWLAARPDAVWTSSELGRVEVLRAARRADSTAVPGARAVTAKLLLVPLDRVVQDVATEIGEPTLRTLDALHLASAASLGEALTAFIVYDPRLAGAARAAGLPVVAPA